MAAKTEGASAITGGQAQYVLKRLMEERRVTAKDVNRYAAEMRREIAALEERLRLLREAARVAPGGRGRGTHGARQKAGTDDTSETRPRAIARRKRRRKLNLSAERRAALKLQGQYLALIRRVSARRRAEFKRLFQEKGPEAALKALREATGK
jgi:hypothetical protein